MYVCPKCKLPLTALACEGCGARYAIVQDIPCFLVARPGDSAGELRRIYDDIYQHHVDVWIDQGRSERFRSYFVELARSLSSGRVLELGCGEGILLAAIAGDQKHGIDPSIHALVRARRRAGAECAVARAEELPFPSASFDLVIAVGVMEHFEKPERATAEVSRVLVPGGHYLSLIHTDMTARDRLGLKVREFLYPRPRPVAFAAWIRKKLWHPIVQPFRKSYSVESARRCLEGGGLAVTQVITRETQPSAPLAGSHVVIFVAQKPALPAAVPAS